VSPIRAHNQTEYTGSVAKLRSGRERLLQSRRNTPTPIGPRCTQPSGWYGLQHCSACVLYSETHSTWNIKHQAMLNSGANCSRHSDKGSALRTFWKLYESGPWRQARWWQMISHSALPKPRVSAFKFFIWFTLVGCFFYMSLSYVASAWLLSISLGNLWAKGGNAHCCGVIIICCEFIIYTYLVLIHLTWNDDVMSEGGCQSHILTLACVILEPKRVLCRR